MLYHQDINLELLKQLDYDDFLSACQTDKYFSSLCQTPYFIKLKQNIEDKVDRVMTIVSTGQELILQPQHKNILFEQIAIIIDYLNILPHPEGYEPEEIEYHDFNNDYIVVIGLYYTHYGYMISIGLSDTNKFVFDLTQNDLNIISFYPHQNQLRQFLFRLYYNHLILNI